MPLPVHLLSFLKDWDRLWALLPTIPTRILLVYDQVLTPYLSPFPSAPAPLTTLALPAGEKSKSLDTVRLLWQQMGAQQMDRHALVIACGGGTICDVVGFAAATFLRGIPLALLPTTLMAAVDASIGGKNGINNEGQKNGIGTIYHPLFVAIDPSWLCFLPKKEISQGLAEVIKYGIITDKSLFSFTEQNIKNFFHASTEITSPIIERCAMHKLRMIEEGSRDLLNFGHTFGHAIESASNYAIPHGDAVAIGMILALRLSQKRGMIESAAVESTIHLLTQAGLPTQLPKISPELLLEKMSSDKKRIGEKITLILAHEIGKVSRTLSVSKQEISSVLM